LGITINNNKQKFLKMGNLKKTDLATTVNITTTYAGEWAAKYVSCALLKSSTIDDGGVTVMPNVKYKSVISKVSTGDLIADGTCDFDASSSVDLDEVVLAPEEFQVNLQLCKKDFIDTWQGIQMGYSAWNPNGLPTSFADYLVAYVASKVASQNEVNVWQGETGNAGEYDGLETLATCAPAPQKLTGAVLDISNIITQMQLVVDAIPNSLYGSEDLKLYISASAAKLYVRALGGFTATIGAAGTDNRGTQWFNNGSLSFGGIPVFVGRGMSDDFMMAAESSNLFFGTGLMSDYNEVRTIDMSETDGSQNVRIVMRFTAGMAIGCCDDVVTYTGS
tara:strand:- start:2661 stop:3662 length:1002 start_codon:yes stop_codon:yes gene_type:complete